MAPRAERMNSEPTQREIQAPNVLASCLFIGGLGRTAVRSYNSTLVDDADFADDGDGRSGQVDFDLGEVAAFGDFAAGIVGPIPEEIVGAVAAAILSGAKGPAADAKAHQVIERDRDRHVL